jgi:cyanophycinase-like exopeptidase
MSVHQGILAVMGSGETAPTMVKVHREVLERLAEPAPKAVLLDTPFGFQENADELCERTQTYFTESVGTPIEVASFRHRDVEALLAERAWRKVRQADYVFAGPGSPTYALATWTGTPLPVLLAETVERGGAVVFSSAAALTLGVATVPVYEIYKVGEEPSWRSGLDVLGALTEIEAAVVPHFNNAEGGTHDTRFCYLGERRLSAMERLLADDVVVLGIDEHTALVLDFARDEVVVRGIGTVTIRWRGRSTQLEADQALSVEDFGRLVRSARTGDPAGSVEGRAVQARPLQAPEQPESVPVGVHPLRQRREELVAAAGRALSAGDPDGVAGALLDLLAEIKAWATDTTETDEVDRAEAAVRDLVVALGELASARPASLSEAVRPLVDQMLRARADARAERAFALADRLRDVLVAAGIEVQDHPGGSTWQLAGSELVGPGGSDGG